MTRMSNAKALMKDVLSPDDSEGMRKLKAVVAYLVKTQYSHKKLLEKLKRFGAAFFEGIPAKDVDEMLDGILESATPREQPRDLEGKQVVVFEEEIKKIRALNHAKAERLAFTFLAWFKLRRFYNPEKPNTYIPENNDELFSLAGLKTVNGIQRIKLLNRLYEAGFVEFKARTDLAKKKTDLRFTVPILVENGTVALEFAFAEKGDIALHYLRYVGDKMVGSCKVCNVPISVTNNKKKYCAACASARKRESNKKNGK